MSSARIIQSAIVGVRTVASPATIAPKAKNIISPPVVKSLIVKAPIVAATPSIVTSYSDAGPSRPADQTPFPAGLSPGPGRPPVKP